MENKEYKELLKDPRWQKMKALVMIRDNFTCQLCRHTDRTLHVHHLRYHNEPWNVAFEDLITLCENCHKSIHEDMEKGISWDIDKIKWWGNGIKEYEKTVEIENAEFNALIKHKQERWDVKCLVENGLIHEEDTANIFSLEECEIKEMIKGLPKLPVSLKK